MKLFEVTIDNNPGGWKSGLDPFVLVIAKDKEEAIQKVINGWSKKWYYKHDENDGIPVITYLSKGGENNYVRIDSQFSAKEIRFEEYDVHIKTPRKAKLDRIEKHINRKNID